jgi:tetratricopeptide (TPR) repeat protein
MRKAALLLAIAAVFAGCRGMNELELRYEAERLRWRIDRAERRQRASRGSHGEKEVTELRRLHDEVQRRFGAETPPTPEMLQNPDTIRRLRIAGASSLYGADLAAAFDPSTDTLEEYAHIARTYAFDRELGYRALFGQARLLEKLGRLAEALDVYLVLLERYPPIPPRDPAASLPSLNPVLLDMEVHVLALAQRVDPQKLADLSAKMLPLLESRDREWSGTKLERPVSLHRSHALFVAGQWDEGLHALQRARDLAPSDPERAVDGLEITQVLWRGKRDLRAAGEAARLAVERGAGTPLEAEARMDLAKILLQEDRVAEAIEQLDELLRVRPRFLEGRQGEAYYLKGMALVALKRWEDALPRLEGVAEVDAEGCFAIEARIEMMRRLRALQFESGEQAARGAVDLARRVRSSTESREPPFGWDGFWWRPIEEEKWARCIRSLREIADAFPEGDLAASALEQAERLEKERIHHPIAADSPASIKREGPAAETGVAGETS